MNARRGVAVFLTGLTVALPAVAHDGPGPCDQAAAECRNCSSQFAYPMQALREDAEGDTTIVVGVDLDGHVSDCRVVRSSGHPALDAATCDQYSRYAHFLPAEDEDGKPVVARYQQTMKWRTEAKPLASEE